MNYRAMIPGRFLMALMLAVMAASAQAVIINPVPAVFAADDGSQLFNHNQSVFSVEVFDASGAAEFGFYFAGDSANRTAIFDATDTPGNSAFIDFALGRVIDVDALSVQSLFTASMSPIGFYLTIAGTTLFTEAALNPGGLDLAATFPAIASPMTYLMGFEVPGIGTLSFDVVAGLNRVVIPEPAGLALLVLGLALVPLSRLAGTPALPAHA